MLWIFELIGIVSKGLAKFSPAYLSITFAAAVSFAALCGWVCLHYVQLWNLKFQLTKTHRFLTAFACTLTFFFVLAFAGLTFVREVASTQIVLWKQSINQDQIWSRDTFKEVYYAVKQTDKEDFTNNPTPENGGTFIPITKAESRLLAAKIYADEACSHFNAHHPFLRKFLWTSASLPTTQVKADVDDYFKTNPASTYPSERAITLAADHIQTQLIKQTPRIVTVSRIGLVIAFFLVQLIPFGLIGYAAYKDIKASI